MRGSGAVDVAWRFDHNWYGFGLMVAVCPGMRRLGRVAGVPIDAKVVQTELQQARVVQVKVAQVA
jgi:hypothetical protein